MATLVGLAPFFNFPKKAAWYCGKCTRLNSNFPHLLTVCLWTNYSTSLSFWIFIMKTWGKINWVLFQLKWSKKCWYVFYTTWGHFPSWAEFICVKPFGVFYQRWFDISGQFWNRSMALKRMKAIHHLFPTSF